jgi:hypothetical protein
MRLPRRAAGPPALPAGPHPAPRAPQLRLWKLTGYGKLRATTRPPSGPSHTPRKSWAPARRPPRITRSSHSRGDEVGKRQKEEKR